MEHFRTKDLALASVLLQERYHLVTLDRSQQSVDFVFEDSPELQETVARYWRDELLCPAQSLLASLRRAKRLLYDASI